MKCMHTIKIIKKIIKKIIAKIQLIELKNEIKRYVKHSKYFNKKWYIKTYPEIEKEEMKPYYHYYKIGWKKGYNPSINFSTNKYLEMNQDVQMCPLFHYEKYGKKEGRKTFYVDNQYDHNYKKKTIRRFIKRKVSNIINYKKIKKNQNVKILVYIHIFYIYSIPEIIEYLKNLEKYNYDLIISCTKGNHTKVIIKQIKKFNSKAKIYVLENKGYDIGPFIEILNKVDLKKYDILFKLQSKGTFHRTSYIYGQIFKNRDWFEYMFEATLGTSYIHKNIDKLYNNDKIGIIAAENLIIEDPKHKQHFTIQHLKKHNLELKENYKFVAGTVYATKASLVEKIKNLKLSINDFEKTEKGYFSFAHALERYLTASTPKKYIIYGNNVCKIKKLLWKKANEKIQNIIGARLLNDQRYELSDDFALRYVEHTPIDKYEIIDIKINNINKNINNKIKTLEECYPFLLLNGNTKEYTKKCLKYRRTDYMMYSQKEFEKICKKECVQRYKQLIKNIDINNYNKKQLIVINQNNSILDGQHRACYLLKKFGPNYKIRVLKIYESKIDIDKIKHF